MKSLLVLCWVICTAMGMSMKGPVRRKCPWFLSFSDAVSLYPDGKVWQERCRTCRCSGEEVTCSLNEGVVCDKPYDPSYDRVCIKWSDDRCCCEEVGCTMNGKNYKFGEYYREDPDDPCSAFCKCSPFVKTCVIEMGCGIPTVQMAPIEEMLEPVV